MPAQFSYLSQVVNLTIPFVDLLYALEHQPHFCLLDSSLVDKQSGKYSVLYVDPFTVTQGSTLRDWNHFKEMFTCCQQLMGDVQEDLPFISGVAGMMSYDFGVQFEGVASLEESTDMPGFVFGFYDTAFVYDHDIKRLTIYSTGLPQTDPVKRAEWAEHRLEEMMQLVSYANVTDKPNGSNMPRMTLKETVTRKEYEKSVEKALEHIKQGDIYQVNLSQRFDGECVAEPKYEEVIGLYERLRDLSPAGFAGCCRADKLFLLSSSPERFLQLRGRTVETRPMKGTRPRGANVDQDEQLRGELWESVKDKAELLMITDLLRNDLGRVCDYGSVTVSELRTMEEYQTVFQTTSTVKGILAKDKTAFDLIEACFPGGSITGCPKIRSMTVIRELEKQPRQFYTGSLGYIDFMGNMDFNVLIRTITLKNNHVYFHVGGGVVSDSEPAKEYEETLVKARAMMVALKKDGAGSV